MSTKYWFTSSLRDRSDAQSKLLARQIKDSDVDLIAILGNSKITVKEFVVYRLGCIKLDTRQVMGYLW